MSTLLGFIKKELIALRRDPIMLAAILILPIVQVIILSQAITFEARNLRLVIDTIPDDTIMTRVYDHALGSGWFKKVAPLQKSAVEAVQAGEADVALIAPKGGLTRSLIRGEGELQILIDATNVLKAQSIEGYLQGIISGVLTQEIHISTHNPIHFSTRLLFNPELNTQWFLIPAISAVLVLMSLLTLISVSIAREKENGTIETLISAPISKYDIILGKTIPYIFVAFVNMFLIQTVGWFFFDMSFNGSFLMFVLSFMAFCLPATATAVWLATYTKTQQQAMLGLIIIIFLALMLSGAFFPRENMPEILQWISYINPLTHYTYLVRNIILKGAGWDYFAEHVGVLLLSGTIIAAIALKRFKTTL